jgi:hypothetical protein
VLRKNEFIKTCDTVQTGEPKRMNTQDNQSRKIDFLQLSDSEKTEFIKELKEVLHEKIEEAKFWRTLIESDGIIVNGNPVAF